MTDAAFNELGQALRTELGRPPTLVERFATPEPVLCPICRRRAGSVGYASVQRGPVLWLCDDTTCHKSARGFMAMPAKKLDEFEKRAAELALAEAGPFLDSLGETDLVKLTPDQLAEFCAVFVRGFEDGMRKLISGHVAPF